MMSHTVGVRVHFFDPSVAFHDSHVDRDRSASPLTAQGGTEPR
jgi:hypothetical protein